MRWIIGDVHGMLRPLEALLAAIDRRDDNAHCIFVGDYVNRGPDSRGVIDLLLKLPRATFARGNHDDIFDLILHGDCYMCHQQGHDPVSAFTWFMQYGLDRTFTSYGADLARLEHLAAHPNPQKIAELKELVPETHRAFIRELAPVIEHPDIFVVHGSWDPDTADHGPDLLARVAQQPKLRHPLLWGRFTEPQLQRKKRWRRTGYFGHTPVVNYRMARGDYVPLRGPGLVLLDTASALAVGGMLSAACVESGALLQADRAGGVLEGLL